MMGELRKSGHDPRQDHSGRRPYDCTAQLGLPSLSAATDRRSRHDRQASRRTEADAGRPPLWGARNRQTMSSCPHAPNASTDRRWPAKPLRHRAKSNLAETCGFAAGSSMPW